MEESEELHSAETEKNVLLAIRAVEEDGMKKKAAALKYGVSQVALKRRLHLTDTKFAGRPKFFSRKDEEILYQMLKSIHLLQQPFTKELFLEAAKKLADKKGYGEHNFGNSWLYGFMKRHPDLSVRKKTAKDKLPRWNKEKCDTFIEVMGFLNREGYLADPRAIFALTSLEAISPPTDKNKKKPIIPIRKKSKVGTEKGFSVIACGSATGQPLRAMILREGSVILEPWFSNTNEEVTIGQNDTGVFGTETIGAYIKHELIPYIQALNPPVDKSVIFADDRWLASYNLDIIEMATQNNLQIVPFPIGHCDKVQPLEKSEFRLLTRIWLEFVGERDRPLNEFVRTNTLARTLMASKRRLDMVKIIHDGFRNKGIFPFDQSLIRSTVLTHGRPTVPLRAPSTVYDAFLKRFESYTIQLGTDCGMSEEKLKPAMEAFRCSIINSGLALQPGSRQIATTENTDAAQMITEMPSTA